MMTVAVQNIPYKALRENSEFLVSCSQLNLFFLKKRIHLTQVPEPWTRWRSLSFGFLACGIVFGLIYGYIKQRSAAGNTMTNLEPQVRPVIQ